jgi:hemoglobin
MKTLHIGLAILSNYLKVLVITGLAGTCTFAACNKEEPPQAPATLYERLGGVSVISAVVDQFIENVAGDGAVNTRYNKIITTPSQARQLRLNLIDQFCAATGGPYSGKGRRLKAEARNMKITQAEFYAMKGDLVSALDQLNVPENEKIELMELIAPVQAVVVSQ